MFQTLAYHSVQSQQVFRRNTFSIRRVGDDDTLFLWLFELLERLYSQYYILAYSSSLYVVNCYFVSLWIIIVSIDFVSKFTFLRIVVIDRVEQLLVVVFPFFKAEFLTEYTRSDIAGNQSSFNRNCSRATHRINQIAFPSPSGHQNHTGSQYLIQRCFYLFLTIAAAVQRFARTV